MAQSELFDVGNDNSNHLDRFSYRNKDRLAACAQISPRVAQLAQSFPVLFFALASGYGPLADRKRAIELAVDGKVLARVAAVVGLPMSFRRLPPEACKYRMPHVVWSAEVNRELAPLVPTGPRISQGWLTGISHAARVCDEEVAVWLARHHSLFALGLPEPRVLTPLMLHAWSSKFAPETLKTAPAWHPSLEIDTALHRAVNWLKQVRLRADLGPDGLADGWLPPDEAGGMQFVPLTAAPAIIEEADVMGHCVVEYGGGLARNLCRIFSIRRDGACLATMEVRPCVRTKRPMVVQLKGPRNGDPGLEVWHAAMAYVERYADVATGPLVKPGKAADEFLRATFADYREALPEQERRYVDTLTFNRLMDDVAHLGRLTGSTPRWLRWG